jgi:hypothetical protein
MGLQGILAAAALKKGKAARKATSPCKYLWLRGRDLNPRPLGYEPNELPDCSTPRQEKIDLNTRDARVQLWARHQ